MTVFETGYYKINRVSLCLCGVWPEQNSFQAYIARFLLWGGMATIMIPEYVCLYKAWVYGSFMEDFLPCIPTQLLITAVAAKYVVFAIYKKTFQDTIDKMRIDFEFFGNTPARKILKEYADKGRTRTIFYGCFLFMILTTFVVPAFLPVVLDKFRPLNETRIRLKLLDTDYGVDPDEYFVLITIHGYIASTFLVLMLWSVDSFIMIMVQHCCSLFVIVGFTLKKLDQGNKKHTEKFENDVLINALQVHQQAIEFADFIEASLKNMYGIVIIENMLAISITGLETIKQMDQTDQAMRFAAFAFGQMVHLFFNSLPGQELVDHSTGLFDLVYDCQWESLSIKSKKKILLILMRSAKPKSLTAGGFYELNLQHCGEVLKTSMSYLTVLTSMR
uniref:Odorant receptor n=1 Tax=Aphidius gifuensis TaxID=684658 RepID=A0A3S5HSS0_APHGI|nr:odorant receptor [Aphidius gifuensis]